MFDFSAVASEDHSMSMVSDGGGKQGHPAGQQQEHDRNKGKGKRGEHHEVMPGQGLASQSNDDKLSADFSPSGQRRRKGTGEQGKDEMQGYEEEEEEEEEGEEGEEEEGEGKEEAHDAKGSSPEALFRRKTKSPNAKTMPRQRSWEDSKLHPKCLADIADVLETAQTSLPR
jgi:cobalamin biosynthesis protein CobT